MAKTIVFVQPPLSLEKRYGVLAQAGYREPAFGLCYLAAVTRQHGFNTSIVDAEALNLNTEKTVDSILSFEPDYVGITATTQLIRSAAAVAKEIKNRGPKIKVIIGGVHVTALPKETLLENSCFDYAVIGEGEETLVELLNALETKKDLELVKGLAIRQPVNNVFLTEKRPFIKNLDTLPYPAFDLLPNMARYYRVSTQSVNRLPALSLVTSRGCPGKCTFCDTSVHGHIPRAHSAEYVANLMKILNKEYGAKSILFDDDNFLTFRPRLKELVKIIKSEGLDLTWSCMGRVDMADFETLRIAKSGGCWQIMYGIETGSQKLLDFYKKNITLEQIEHAIKVTKQAGLKIKGFIMFGNPLETRDSIKATIGLIKRLDLDDVSISFFTPFPGSAIYKEVENYGKFERDWERMSSFDVVFVPNGFTKKELQHYSKMAFRQFYLRPRIIFSYLRRITSPTQFKELVLSGLALLRYIFSIGVDPSPDKIEVANWKEVQEELADDDIHSQMYESKNPIVRYISRKRLESISSLIDDSSKPKILEIGCGDGFVLKTLESKSAELHGIDISTKRVERAKRFLPHAKICEADAENLPFEDNCFNVTVCSEVLEHLKNPQKAVEEMIRVTKKSGDMIVSVPNEFNWHIGRLLLLRFPLKIPDHLNKFSVKELDGMFNRRHIKLYRIPAFLPKYFSLTYVLYYKK